MIYGDVKLSYDLQFLFVDRLETTRMERPELAGRSALEVQPEPFGDPT